MSSVWRRRWWLWLVVAVIVVLVVFNLAGREKPSSNPVMRSVQTAVAPVQDVLVHVPRAIGQWAQAVANARAAQAEVAQLQQQLAQLNLQRDQLAALQTENQQLRDALHFKQQIGSRFVTMANVVARNPDQWQQFVTIDAGQQQGVSVGMAVTDTSGAVVGRIINVTPTSAKVELLSNPARRSGIGAVIDPVQGGEPVYTTVNGINSEGLFVATFVRTQKGAQVLAGENLQQGSLVRTSGYDQQFPAHLQIGHIAQIQQPTPDSRVVSGLLIQPAADFQHLSLLVVVAAEHQS
ncbi:MAG: rod shape-determining protein MreC [Firmicutes bacterium]|nr:rod shape-determining protein MreC [Bacillota bacterium]